MISPPNENKELFSVSVIILEKNGLPCVEIRKTTNNPELIKQIISCAFYDQPITIMPKFFDKLRAISTLTEKGIIYKKEKENKFYFTF